MMSLPSSTHASKTMEDKNATLQGYPYLLGTSRWKDDELSTPAPSYGFASQLSSAPRQRDPVGEKAQGVCSELLTDAAIMSHIHSATQSIADKDVRDTLQSGTESAVEALQKRVSGHGLHISFDE